MIDAIAAEKRSQIMRRVRRKNTAPEIVVRKLIFSMGYRYRLHRKQLPGSPDIVFPGKKKIIFVHGCFWHMHECKKGRPPKSNENYWLPKLERNKQRDNENLAKLEIEGWKVLVIWECQLKDLLKLEDTIKAFLSDG
jgi:DNA mismatch endonuclease (patch repair protein)